jgi:hypothetical protein
MKSFWEFCEEMNMPLHLVANDEEFWTKFGEIANSIPDDLASFLNVPPETVRHWHTTVAKALKLSQEKKARDDKNEVLPTGNSN